MKSTEKLKILSKKSNHLCICEEVFMVEDAADSLIWIWRLQPRSNGQFIRINRNMRISARIFTKKHNVEYILGQIHIYTRTISTMH